MRVSTLVWIRYARCCRLACASLSQAVSIILCTTLRECSPRKCSSSSGHLSEFPLVCISSHTHETHETPFVRWSCSCGRIMCGCIFTHTHAQRMVVDHRRHHHQHHSVCSRTHTHLFHFCLFPVASVWVPPVVVVAAHFAALSMSAWANKTRATGRCTCNTKIRCGADDVRCNLVHMIVNGTFTSHQRRRQYCAIDIDRLMVFFSLCVCVCLLFRARDSLAADITAPKVCEPNKCIPDGGWRRQRRRLTTRNSIRGHFVLL